jgi:Zn-dependent protease
MFDEQATSVASAMRDERCTRREEMLGRRWHLFNAGRHPVYMDATFLLLMAFFAFGNVNTREQLVAGLMWVPVLFVGVLLHELGHAAATKAFGYGASTIVLGGLGGVAISEGKVRARPMHAMLISLAGPAASFALAGVSAGALFALEGGLTHTGYVGQLLYLSAISNVFWGVFNMLPIYPMDGGQAVMYGLMAGLKQRRRAVQVTAVVSLVALVLSLGLAFAALRAGMFTILIGLYFGWLNWQLWQSTK